MATQQAKIASKILFGLPLVQTKLSDLRKRAGKKEKKNPHSGIEPTELGLSQIVVVRSNH
jgi:hypothetical protein